VNIRKNEFQALQDLVINSPDIVKHSVLGKVHYKGKQFEIDAFEIGPDGDDIPVFGLFGGVHGVEQIGTHVVISYLNYIIEQLKWDKNIQDLFTRIKLVSIPIVNPVGFAHLKRSNGNGVDLMRNAPIESSEKVMPFVGGQTKSSKIPWFRGDNEKMEIESQILCDFVKEKVLCAKNAMTIDFHSGFGFKDRLWYPYAHSSKKFDELNKINKLENILERTIPHHIYKIEPQSDNYTTHGDLWDYLYYHKKNNNPDNTFIPFTLEMGSWIWLKKNPLQLFSKSGLFNPVKDHRFSRAMRRHFLMIDFFLKACSNPTEWNQ
jgi:hypothetical protein